MKPCKSCSKCLPKLLFIAQGLLYKNSKYQAFEYATSSFPTLLFPNLGFKRLPIDLLIIIWMSFGYRLFYCTLAEHLGALELELIFCQSTMGCWLICWNPADLLPTPPSRLLCTIGCQSSVRLLTEDSLNFGIPLVLVENSILSYSWSVGKFLMYSII